MLTPDKFALSILESYSFLFHRTCDVSGQTSLPRGPKIIAMNHTVGCDPLHLPLILEEAPHFLLQDGLFTIPFIGWLLKETGQIPVCRESSRAIQRRGLLGQLCRGERDLPGFVNGRAKRRPKGGFRSEHWRPGG